MDHGIGTDEALSLLSYFGFDSADELHLATVRRILAQDVRRHVENFYTHLGRFPETAEFLKSEVLTERLQRTQAEYIVTLGDFSVERPSTVAAYFDRRFRVGLAHCRVGLEPKLYLGAYCKLGDLLVRAVANAGASDAIPSLHKVLLLDSHLALEAYQQARKKEIVTIASTDELTGLPLRKPLLQRLGEEVSRASRFGHPFTLLFIDVDHFKQANDTFGHAIGDRVLREVANILQNSVRPMDIVGRYGGDEFLVGLIEGEGSVGEVVAERIRARAANLSVDGAKVTLSIGLASSEENDTVENLIARADATMYEAKSTGRNRVSISFPAVVLPNRKEPPRK